MTAYVLAQITIHDPERYARYQAEFMPVLLKYDGMLVPIRRGPQSGLGRLAVPIRWGYRRDWRLVGMEDAVGFDQLQSLGE